MSPIRSSPASGVSSPAIIRNSVVLPAPFGPITPTMPAGGSENVEVLEEQPVAEALRDALRLDHDVAEPRAGRDVDLDLVELHVLLLGEQLLVRAEPRLRLRVAGLRARRTHSSSRASVRWRAELCLLLDLQPRLLLLEPAGVVALVGDAAAAVELEDPAGDVVEEVPVVRHRDDRALVVGEEALEPEHRLGVEVVRRLVEQQQVGRGEEQPAERDPAALAAGERRDVAVASGRRSASIAWSSLSSSCQAPRRSIWSCTFACSASSVSKSASGSENCAEISLKRSSRSRSSRTPSSTFSRTSLAGSSSGSCSSRPTRRVRRELGDAGGRLFLAGHDPQQRRLARAVRAEHADLRSRQERERDVREHLAVGAVELVGPVHREDVVRRHDRPADR